MPQSGFELNLQSKLNGTSYQLQVNGTVPNDGLYPVEFDGLYTLTSDGAILTQSALSPVTIQPGRINSFSDMAVLDFIRMTISQLSGG